MKKWYKLCPYCANEIKGKAIKCQYCWEFLQDENKKNLQKKEKKECPFCLSLIDLNENICPFCKENLILDINTKEQEKWQKNEINAKKDTNKNRYQNKRFEILCLLLIDLILFFYMHFYLHSSITEFFDILEWQFIIFLFIFCYIVGLLIYSFSTKAKENKKANPTDNEFTYAISITLSGYMARMVIFILNKINIIN